MEKTQGTTVVIFVRTTFVRRLGHLFFTLWLTMPATVFSGNDIQPGGARASAMADASVCLQDAWCTCNNPAGLAFLKHAELDVSYNTPFLLSEIGQAGIAAALPSKGGGWGLFLSSVGTEYYQENKTGLSFALRLGPRFSAGVQLDAWGVVIAGGYGSSYALDGDIGFQAMLTKTLMVGAHVINPTRAQFTGYSAASLPVSMSLGMAYEASSSVLLTAEAQKETYFPPAFKFGLEYKPATGLFVRTGISAGPWTYCLGAGYQINKLKLDFSSTWHPVLGFTPGIGIGFIF